MVSVSERGIHLEAWNIVIDFDIPVDRQGTNSLKWERYAGRDVIPLWVADMDFPAPDFITEALAERLQARGRRACGPPWPSWPWQKSSTMSW